MDEHPPARSLYDFPELSSILAHLGQELSRPLVSLRSGFRWMLEDAAHPGMVISGVVHDGGGHQDVPGLKRGGGADPLSGGRGRAGGARRQAGGRDAEGQQCCCQGRDQQGG